MDAGVWILVAVFAVVAGWLVIQQIVSAEKKARRQRGEQHKQDG